MSAIKQQQSVQTFSNNAYSKSSDLTQQERRALNLVWRDDESDTASVKSYDSSTEHCAELGYN